ncbi:MAG: response regulator [Minisyncoccia bacterium]
MSNTQPEESNIKKIHILMVDDDPMLRRLFGGRLVALGYDIIYASDGNEGRETARRLQPDLVLMDQKMPVMDGLEATSRMKSEIETKNIPIILFTNEDYSLETEMMAKDLGADAYVHKSSEFSVLVETIKNLLEKDGKTIPLPEEIKN